MKRQELLYICDGRDIYVMVGIGIAMTISFIFPEMHLAMK